MDCFTKVAGPGLSLENLREEYRRGALDEATCDPNPIEQFRQWVTAAQLADLKEPNAMTLSTCTPDGRPSGRIVLLKEITASDFIFYTNYRSRKGREIEANPYVALTFYWAELERQVRIEGTITKVSREKSEAYFQGRPKGSRLGALVSNQSEILLSRKPVEERLLELERRYRETDDVPTPELWGGYAVQPNVIEFWQGRPNRLHDRIVYERKDNGEWDIRRLSP